MSARMRWVVAAVAAVLVVCLIGWARGEEHHRGDDVGSLGNIVTAVAGP
jgi:hypothetical protein